MSDEFELSDSRRTKLIAFIERFDQLYGDGNFNVKTEWSDPELLCLALRCAEILGLAGEQLEEFFEREFDVAGMGESEVINDMLAVAMMVDVEHRIRVAAGGRN